MADQPCSDTDSGIVCHCFETVCLMDDLALLLRPSTMPLSCLRFISRILSKLFWGRDCCRVVKTKAIQCRIVVSVFLKLGR